MGGGGGPVLGEMGRWGDGVEHYYELHDASALIRF